jgi:hypothetical protein
MFRFALASTLATSQAAELAVTWKDCGAKHGVVEDVQPSTIHTGATETITGSGTSDEDVTSAQFTATLSALGTTLTSCGGDATTDIVCNLPMGVGSITVKAVTFPMLKGATSIPVEVSTSSLIPPSLANVDVHIEAVDQNGESAICLDVHTAAQQMTQDDHPHLAQAWQALSSGDGLPNTVGLESYIYEDCPKNHFTEECMSGHVFDYGADNCIKYEVNMGLKSKYTGTYYVKCDAVDCCKDDSPDGDVPNVKKWDIGQSKKSAITHMEATDLDDLDGHVAGADTWLEDIKVLGAHVKYTYYVTQSENGDVISHAIDYVAPGASPGRILYGNFTVKHADELDAFREVFKAPEACLRPNTLSCGPDTVKKWGRKSMPATMMV